MALAASLSDERPTDGRREERDDIMNDNTTARELDLFTEDLHELGVDQAPDAVSAAMSQTRSTFSCVGSVSTATCAATTGTLGTASSF